MHSGRVVEKYLTNCFIWATSIWIQSKLQTDDMCGQKRINAVRDDMMVCRWPATFINNKSEWRTQYFFEEYTLQALRAGHVGGRHNSPGLIPISEKVITNLSWQYLQPRVFCIPTINHRVHMVNVDLRHLLHCHLHRINNRRNIIIQIGLCQTSLSKS